MDKEKTFKEISVKGHKLECPVCKNNKFWTKETLMNTTGMTFFGLDWANKDAKNFICSNCTYVFWFFPDD